jgi:DNA replication and repair protein RecF
MRRSSSKSASSSSRKLLPFFNAYYQQICNSKEQVGLNYISQLSDSDLEKELRLNRERDLIIGYTSVGIHKDELEMKLGDYLIRRIGSQGQNKTYLIALKLAQFAYLKSQGMTNASVAAG